MISARSAWRIAAAISLAAGLAGTRVCRADCGHAVYAYDDKVVVFACSKVGPELRVILLDDASSLRVTGRVGVPSSREFDTAGHYQDLLMLVRWDKFEVYDLSDPAKPALAAKFDLRKQQTFPGYARIEQTAESKFLLLTALGAAEVTADAEPSKWTVKEVSPGPEISKKMSSPPPEFRFLDENEHDVPLRQSGKFRYAITWNEKSKPGEIAHRQYLHKVEIASQKDVSVLLLGEREETID